MALNDQKDNFCANPTCCLINPSKNELTKVSKQLVEKINSGIIDKLQFKQWRNTDTVLKWFKNTTDNSNCSFIQFDIKYFHSSITESILHQTLEFAKQHTNIEKSDLHIMNYCRKSKLFSSNKKKRGKKNN